MSDLEERGYLYHPHTSAGRIPTARGYRLFVDTMLTVRRDALPAVEDIAGAALQAEQPRQVLSQAAQMLSNLSQFVGVVIVPKRPTVFRHIEFLSLSDRRVLVILVSPDGEVQNRIIHTQVEYTQSQLQEAANFLNNQYAGLTIDQVRERLRTEAAKEDAKYSVLHTEIMERAAIAEALGVRMALGADAARILRMVLGQGAWQLGLGLFLGVGVIALVAWFARAPLGNFLFQTNPLDPLPYLGVALLISLVSLAAILVPARRATRVDPMVALRAE